MAEMHKQLAGNRPELARADGHKVQGLALHGQGALRSHRTTLPMSPGARPNLDSVMMPRTGLQLPRQLPFDAWLEVGKRLSTVVSSSAWCLGDWLLYGEVFFTGRYREAIERTSLDYQTLRNYAWVARKFALRRRWESLSFGHHAEVAALSEPEQDYWLRKANDLGWSRNRIRHEIRTSLRERNDDEAGQQDPAGTPVLTLQMKVTPGQLELFKQAAGQVGHTLEDWALLILDNAAHEGLPVGQAV
jgi:hypothetical protein